MKKYSFFFMMFFILFSFIKADDISETLKLNGFLSQGYVKSWDANFLPNSKESGSLEMNELGMTVSAQISDKLRFGFQMLSRDFGPWGNNVIKLDWGFADYHFSDLFGIRVGKIKTPKGLYNEIRDTDILRPMAILPQSNYDEYMRNTIVAFNGAAIYGYLPLGFMGDLSYDAYFGTKHHPSDASYITTLLSGINQNLSQNGLNMTDLQMDTKSDMGIRLIWETPISGLRLSGTYMYFSAFLKANINHPSLGQLPSTGLWETKGWFVASAEYIIGNFTLSAEYQEAPILLNMDILGNQTDMANLTNLGYYIMGSWLFGEKFTISSFYDEFYSDKNNKQINYQKDLAVGIRYDFNMNWNIKIEGHFMSGTAMSYIFYQPEALNSSWKMLIVKSSYSF